MCSPIELKDGPDPTGGWCAEKDGGKGVLNRETCQCPARHGSVRLMLCHGRAGRTGERRGQQRMKRKKVEKQYLSGKCIYTV